MQTNPKITPKKHYGQNFLKDSIILDKILQASSELYESCLARLQSLEPESKPAQSKKNNAQDSNTSTSDKARNLAKANLALVEIGVGLGDLSRRLVSIAPLIAYEIDDALCSFVSQRFKNENLAKYLDLRQADVLSLPFARQANAQKDSSKSEKRGGKAKENLATLANTFWLATTPYVLISNLPYYIATRIILTALKDPLCVGFVVMTQKEVADKFCASSGESEFCALSVLAQSAGEIKHLFDVPKEAFEPAPKVASSVFSLRKNTQAQNHTLDSRLDFDGFENLLKIAFCSPRKKLFSNLAKSYDKAELKEIYMMLDLSSEARAHQLSTQDYHQIFTKLYKG